MFKRAAGALGWYVAINVAAVGPYLVLAAMWPKLTGAGCCDPAPAVLSLLGLLWGSAALAALVIPFQGRKGFALLASISAIVWIRMWGTVISVPAGDRAQPLIIQLVRLVDAPLKLVAAVLLICYIVSGYWSFHLGNLSKRLALPG